MRGSLLCYRPYLTRSSFPLPSQGCCGAPTPEKPQRQACGPEYWRYLNADTNVRCVAATGGQQTPINFQTVGNDTLTFTEMVNKTGSDEAGKTAAKLAFSDQQWCVVSPGLATPVIFTALITLHPLGSLTDKESLLFWRHAPYNSWPGRVIILQRGQAGVPGQHVGGGV